MSSSLYKPYRDDGDPFDGDGRLLDVVAVEYRTEHLRRDANARQLQLVPGDDVVVDSKYGPVVAEVVGQVERRIVDGELPRILRKADDADLERARENEERERNAYKFALERIRDRELPMKLVRTHWMQDGSRIVFYFTADGRIDFRALVRDLASEFRTRIEMRQIGVRDGAQMLGGIGPCGRELCCSTFLQNFEPISIRIAREQGLTLNPNKISGMCGRLMCCLVYEQQLYKRIQSRLPEAGQAVATEYGEATIDRVDVLNRRVDVSYEDGRERTMALTDVRVLGDDSSPEKSDTPDDDDKLWDGDPPRKKVDESE